ncbi:hypothetical protein D9615_001719 [Tricholomella constricta]|uniref:RING-type domain-containing protein n=1 Tax=Tricholomella constricta TaxID=117010 RepID=A0A8H5HP18_9AGAR|nr:hypothetical protein D9615_001719 [Tricholomella constricta]
MPAGSLNCHICYSSQPASDFRFFPCGHGYCTSCVENLFEHNQRNPTCAHCRAKLYRRDAHVVYLDIPSPEEEQAAAVDTLMNGLNQMGQDSRVVSVETAGKKLMKFARSSVQSSESKVEILLQVIDDFKKRIVPVFKRAEEQAAQIEQLKENLQTCRDDLAASVRRAEPLEKELTNIRNNLHQMEEERDQAIDLARLASGETVQLREDLASSKSKVSDLEEKTHRYKGQLVRHTKAAQQQANKIKILEAKEIANKDEARQEVDRGSEFLTQDCRPRTLDATTPTISQPVALSTQVNSVQRDFEGMPPPGGFRSDWQLSYREKKRKFGLENQADRNFPLTLDKKMRPVGRVQIGIRTTLRAPLR